MGKKKIVVPYRDSVLTKLLQNALGGNRLVFISVQAAAVSILRPRRGVVRLSAQPR